MMKVAIYVRVSRLDLNPENQLMELKKYAKAMGYEFDVYVEKKSTRKTRPIKQIVLQKARNREYDGILVWKLDRWARSVRELITELDEFIHKNIKFTCMTFPVDISRPEGKMVATVIGAMAEMERELIRERTLAGLARAKAHGKKLGRPKGAKDRRQRKKSGYYLRYAGKKTRGKYQGGII